jgi:hypothetical protein
MNHLEKLEGHCDHPFEEVLISSESSIAYQFAESCTHCFDKLLKIEQSLVQVFYSQIPIPTNPLNEELILDKFELLSEKIPSKPVPDFLKTYIHSNLHTKSEQSDSLVVRIAKDGIHLVHSFFEHSKILLSPSFMQTVRSNEENSTLQNSIFLKEEKDDKFDLIYQIIKENETQAYLSIQFKSNSTMYRQVILKKDDRFIYSSQMDNDGGFSFSGLSSGNYSLEFIGKIESKSIDLTILV